VLKKAKKLSEIAALHEDLHLIEGQTSVQVPSSTPVSTG
jgi:uncharacterized NAD-dependent epimerase/dehydratase family protein